MAAMIRLVVLLLCAAGGLSSNPNQTHSPQHVRVKRFITQNQKNLWEKGVLPYKIIDDPPIHTEGYLKAIAMYHEFSCIRMVPWSTNVYKQNGLTHKTFITFHQIDGCFASLGFNRNAPNGHTMNCCDNEPCLHELGHVLGFSHEQESPLKAGWLRTNNENIWPKSQGLYKTTNDKNYYPTKYKFDMSSPMLYGPGEPHMPVQSQLFPELPWIPNYFYFFRELSDAYKCYEHKPCSGSQMKCVNEGYTTVFQGKCKCMCLRELDPDTGCSTVLQKVKASWPLGKYALPMFEAACFDRFQESSLTLTSGGKTLWKQNYCTRLTNDYPTGDKYNWPMGNFCVFRKGGKCPFDFTSATIGFTSATNTSKGYIPDYKNNVLHLCCQMKGFEWVETIFPTEKPFTLIRNGQECQKIRGMRVKLQPQTVRANPSSYTVTGLKNYHLRQDGGSLKIDYCHYTPKDMDCGGVITLDTNTRTTTVQMSGKGRTNLECSWLIKTKGDAKGTMVLNFEDFNVKSCDDHVEVKHARMGHYGNKYCEKEKVKHSIRSITNKMMVKFVTTGKSGSSFKATIRWVPDEDMCYNVKDKGVSYNGKVSFTRLFEPCLPWSQVAHCQHHPSNSNDGRQILEGNYCRNPDNSFRPWCYTEAEGCKRDYCDICGLEKLFDKREDCATLKSQGFCTRDTSQARRMCAATCSNQLPNSNVNKDKYSSITCGRPMIPKDGKLIGKTRSSYKLGDEVRFQCETKDYSVARSTCMSSGDWSPIGTACHDIPKEFVRFNNAIYQLVAGGKTMTFDQARAECKKIGGYIPAPKSVEQNDIIKRVAGGSFVWLGINDRNKEGEWIDEKGNKQLFTYWSAHEPNNIGNEDCVVISGSTWIDVSCNVEYGVAVCAKDENPSDGLCSDYLGNGCKQLLEDNPAMCQEYPKFAQQNCRKQCGYCTASSGCGIGEMFHNGMCYKRFEEHLSFDDAVKTCKENSKTLAAPRNREESDKIDKFMAGINLFWVGIEDRAKEGSWVYTNGKGVSFKLWNTGEPNNHGDGEDCAVKTVFTGWADVSCDGYKVAFLCSGPVPRYVCKTGENLYQGQCYKAYHTQQPYDEAVKTCAAEQKIVAAPHDSFEDTLMNSLMKESYFVGITDRAHEGQWVYSNGDSLVYTKWNKGEPNNHGNEDCVLTLPGGGWADVSCQDYKLSFICSGPATKTVCQEGETLFEGECYEPVYKQQNFKQALSICQNRGKTLAAPRSVQESSLMDNFMQGKGLYWIGLDDKTKEGEWKYTDGKQVGWTNWKTGEPNDYGSGEDCGIAQSGTGWADVSCLHYYSPFVCRGPVQRTECPKPTASGDSQLEGKLKAVYSQGDMVPATLSCGGAEQKVQTVCMASGEWSPLSCQDCSDVSASVCQTLLSANPNICKELPELTQGICQNSCGYCTGKKTKVPRVPIEKVCESLIPYLPDLCAKFPSFAAAYCQQECDFKTSCQVPKQDKNVIVLRQQKQTVKVGDYIKQSCTKYLHQHSGDEMRACLPNGQFTGKPLKCAECPLGYTKIGDSCSALIYSQEHLPESLFYLSAMNACANVGGLIAKPKMEDELTKLSALAHKKSIWIDTSDLKSPISCDSPIVPNDGRLVKSATSYTEGSVVSIKCKTSSAVVQSVCKSNGKWTAVDSACEDYKDYVSFSVVSSGLRLTFDQAVKFCKARGGYLPQPVASEDNSIIHAHVRNYVWLGISDKIKEGDWLYSDGTTISWNNWYQNEPDNYANNEHCALMDKEASWRDVNCASSYPTVCVVPKGNCQELSLGGKVQPTECGSRRNVVCSLSNMDPALCYDPKDRGLTYNGKVNTAANGMNCLPWAQATKCKTHPYQTGLKINNLDHNYCRNPDKSAQPWCYVEGCNIEYCDVCNTGNANDQSKNKNYQSVVCSPPTAPFDGQVEGTARTVYRLGEQVQFKCKTNGFRVTKTCLTNGQWSQAGTACTECPIGYTLHKNTCYKHEEKSLHHADAKHACLNEGTHLPHPTTSAQNEIVSKLGSDTRVWLGANLNGKSLKWEDGKPVLWKNWDKDFPKTPSSCVFMTAAGKWQNMDCSWLPPKMSLVCAVDKQVPSSKDYLDEQCNELLHYQPNMCVDHAQFAHSFCARTCVSPTIAKCSVPQDKLVKASTTKSTVTQGEKVSFSCLNNDYIQMKGDNDRVCMYDGALSGQPIVCKDAFDKSLLTVGSPTLSGLDKYIPLGVIFLGVNDLFTIKQTGQVVAWRYDTHTEADTNRLDNQQPALIYFQVWRNVQPDEYELVGQNQAQSHVEGENSYTVPVSSRITVQPGDVIGVMVTQANSLRYHHCSETEHPGWSDMARTAVSNLLTSITKGEVYTFKQGKICIRFGLQAIIST